MKHMLKKNIKTRGFPRIKRSLENPVEVNMNKTEMRSLISPLSVNH